MKMLLAGYQRFRANGWPAQRKAFQSLARDGQSPKALVVACVDSRVDPAMIFDAAPGEILTLRNVANLVPPYAPDAAYHGTSAALEFAVRVLEVPHVMVLGHGQCGGVNALLNGAPGKAQEFVAPWMSIASPARDRALACSSVEERQRCCEQEVIKVSLSNLMTFPWIAERVEAGKLELHGAWFAIYTGMLMTLQPDGSFAPPALETKTG
ncbi:MAG TPA: carbonic anhydrase [Bryobacteraceae bacterium]|jgi:carbonic anhydrase|nr:carbonic anhydrase [Bryobacteraceae bacterium]